MQRIIGGGKYPKFKSPDKKVEVNVGEFYSFPGVFVKQNPDLDHTIEYNKETGSLKVTTKITSFTPLYLYKALLKIALSVLPKEEMANYSGLRHFLLNPNCADIISCPVAHHQLHFDARFAFRILIFEKKSPHLKAPTHFFSIYWLNHIISFHLPNHKNDIIENEDPVIVPSPPPLFLDINDEKLESLKINCFYEDFSSLNMVKGKEKIFEFKLDFESMKSLWGKNMDTGEMVEMGEFEVSKINGFFISKDEIIPTIYFDETKFNPIEQH